MPEIFNIEWEGLEELERFFRTGGERFERILKQEMMKYALLVEEGTKALAPKDTGDLEQSINASRIEEAGGEYFFYVGSNLKYALRRHEEPYRMGNHPYYDDGAKFDKYYVGGRGRRTHRKPAWRGERAGRKYLQRTINLTEADWQRMQERVYERLLAGDLM